MRFQIQSVTLPIRLRPPVPMSDEEIIRFSNVNDALRIEVEPNGDLSIMSPSGTDASDQDAEICFQLRAWAKASGKGTTFSSAGGFRLPDGSVRSPDAAFVSWAAMEGLTKEQKENFAPICPEFLIELRSPTDRLPTLQKKMQKWIANGAQLAWLVDPKRRTVSIYRQGTAEVEHVVSAEAVHGEGPVEGFVLDLTQVWS